ncbi:MAG: pyrroline-5-carboxylate reductase [Pacificimonas sp.]
MKIVMVGCGNMAGAMLKRWLPSDKHDFTIVDPGLEAAPADTQLFGAFNDVSDMRFDLVIVGIKPQMIDRILPAYADVLANGGFAISIAAGVGAERISSALGGAPVIRIMPNLPAAYGVGMSALYAAAGIGQAQRDVAEALVAATGSLIWVDDEDRIDRFTAVAGSGPGYIFELMRSFAEAAEALGFTAEEARQLAVQTVRGTAEMAAQEDKPLSELRTNVTSPGGTTQAGLDVFSRNDELADLLRETTTAAYARACELR